MTNTKSHSEHLAGRPERQLWPQRPLRPGRQLRPGQQLPPERQPKRSSLRSFLTATWRRNRDLLQNASTLIATTGVTSGLGFVYWVLAARFFNERSVGYGSAVISAMTLLGTIGMFGLGTLLIGELPRRREPGGLVSAVLITASAGSLVLGVGFAIVAPHVSSNLMGVGDSLERVALFAIGVSITAFVLVLDQATIGMLRGGIQLTRNIAFASAKLLLLPLSAFIIHDALGSGIVFAWVAGMALSLITVFMQLRTSRKPMLKRPDWLVLRGLGKTVLSHNWLNLSIAVPILLMPVLVTVTVSASANASFYVAWMLASFLYLIPTNLSTVLFAIAAADPSMIAAKLRFSLRISFMLGIVGMAVLGLGAHTVLSIFGPGYAHTATLPLLLLVVGYIPMVPRTHYIAVCRAQGRISQAAVILTIGSAMEIIGAVVGGKLDGLVGLSLALLFVRLIEGLMTAPAVVQASLVRTVDRKIPRGTESDAGSPVGNATYEERQEAGIAMLISLAGSAAASQVPLTVVHDKTTHPVVRSKRRG